MESEDVKMTEDIPVNWPIANGKGKGKATEQTDGHDPENLPWYVVIIILLCNVLYICLL